jgi:C4-dicarboxylate transporter/malic acid transport protein
MPGMSQVSAVVTPEQLPTRRPRRVLRDLKQPRDAFANLGPNWFTSVMGTGIVASAAALLPVQVPALTSAALAIWILAAALLIAVVAATTVHWLLYQQTARRHHRTLSMAPFYGAPPMAMMTVGAGALLVGKNLIGLPAAVRVDEILWALGTATGLLCAVAIPVLMFTEMTSELGDVLGSWLMPVVPPMVSAAAGAGLIRYLPAGQDRLGLLVACYAMFGVSLFMSLNVIALLWYRLTSRGVPAVRMVPTLWIVLGPLGQSVTAAGLLAHAAHGAVSGEYASAADAMAVLYGVPVWGFAIAWLFIAAAITLRAVSRGLPFSLTWWSFTFPVGTVVTGTSVLATHTHATFLTDASVGLYALLVFAWVTVIARTAHASYRGSVFLPSAAARSSDMCSRLGGDALLVTR